MNSSTNSMAAVAMCAAMLAPACSDDHKPPKTSGDAVAYRSAAPPTTAPKQAPDAGDRPESIAVDDEISRLCQLPTPHFPFDSSAIRGSAAAALDKLAACFNDGPLQGRSLNVVGYTDPRGEIGYNFALGQRRAGSVTNYLETRGIAEERMSSSSRGEIGATGTDMESWARDRRVEIQLVKEGEAHSRLDLQQK